MTFGKLKVIGKTFASAIIYNPEDYLVNVYECEVCKSRQSYNEEGCVTCKRQAVKEHHEEEARAGML